MKLISEKGKIDCRGCIAGSITKDEAHRGIHFCAPCREGFRRIIRGERLSAANEKVGH